jgi:hypothetical protein
MGIEGVGSSVVIALAAVLWLVYLIPTWFRRREYLATELNAVRLQQTLRILAETAEVPETVRAEATARSVAAQQRVLRQNFQREQAVQRAREAVMSRAAARTLASLKPEVASGVVVHSAAARRLRRSRATTSGVLLFALAAIGLGLTPLFAPAATLLVATGGSVAVGSVALLSALASAARKRARIARELRTATQTSSAIVPPNRAAQSSERAASGWTPVPLPKPLYLGKPAPQSIVSDAALAQTRAALLAEAEEAERMLREAERAAKVTPIIRLAAAESRFARMGIIDDSENTVTNLDDVLRRRRAV